MIVTLKIEITNQIVLDQYAKLLKAQGKGSESATSQSNELEKVITQTLFRGTRVQSGSTGVSAPDFMITDQGMTSLLSTVIGPQILEGEKFADFVGQQLAGDSVSMEAKLLRTNDSGEIKIGQFSIDSDSEKINYYDFTTSQVIDTTRFSVLNALRQNYSSDTAAQPVAQKELKPNPKKSDLFAFIKGISPEFQQFIKKDKAYTALFAMLSADNTVRNTSAEANNLVNQINNRWSEKSLRAELTRLSVSNRLFDYIVKTPELKNQFYSKSRLLSIFRQQENKATALVLSFSETDFTSKFFGARLEGDSIKVFIKSDVEKTFLKELQDKAPSLIMGNNLTEYNKMAGNSPT